MSPTFSFGARTTGLLSLSLAIIPALTWRAYHNADSSTHVMPSELDCIHRYSVQVLSMDPIVLYLDGFLKSTEINHLIEVT